jgi:predicted metalloprotease with PDZ domain
MTEWLKRYLDQPGELDYEPALQWWGLQLDDQASDESPQGWMGITEAGQVSSVARGTPAWRGGINVDDEILAVDGFRVTDSLDAFLSRKAPGDVVDVMLARRGLVRTMSIELEAAPREDWTLGIDPLSGTKFTLRRDRWWGR